MHQTTTFWGRPYNSSYIHFSDKETDPGKLNDKDQAKCHSIFFWPSVLTIIKLFAIQNFTRFSTKTKVVFLYKRGNCYHVIISIVIISVLTIFPVSSKCTKIPVSLSLNLIWKKAQIKNKYLWKHITYYMNFLFSMHNISSTVSRSVKDFHSIYNVK